MTDDEKIKKKRERGYKRSVWMGFGDVLFL